MVWATAIDKESGDRVLVRVKTNLSAKDGGFLYSVEQTQYEGIDTSIVSWKGAIEGSSHQIIRDAESIEDESEDDGEDDSAKEFAKRFLIAALTEKDLLTKELKAQAKDADISWRTVGRAGKELGAKKYNSPMLGGWVWSLKNSSELEAIHSTLGSLPSDEENSANSLVLGKVGKLGKVPAPIGSQVCQTLENGEVCQAHEHKEFGKVPPKSSENLGENPSIGATPTKQYLDESWDRFVNEKDDQEPPFQEATV